MSGGVGLEPVLDLGPMPLADAFPSAEQLAAPDRCYPLELAFSPHCGLLQILETVPATELFCQDYPYYSSVSETLLRHARESAFELIERRGLGPRSLVVELASNDGYLLRNFVERGVPVLGIDPAAGPARAAGQVGVTTLVEFFTRDLATDLRGQGRAADVVMANNVLAHVEDTNGFVAGIRTLLREDGLAVIEVPYVRDMVDYCEYDTIYHEHLCYFSVTALDVLFRQQGLFLNEVRRLAIHGGSLRLFVEPRERVGESVRRMLAEEQRDGLDRLAYYADFGRRVRALRDKLRTLLADLKRGGATIAGYAAAAKGVVQLNYCGIDASMIDYVVDRNPRKQGRYIPGVRIPIYAPERLIQSPPDFLLILAWNFKDEIIAQQAEYARRGGRFIVPVPEPRVLG
ncbi:MAG: class I SAM-dependent methyltransferase [Phycisphaerae bacterium]|nr:class I SAM-dependent methyltransferase [Phycisphaerae bacterium]